MHHLDRTAAPAPPCLATYTHPAHTWKDVGPCKSEMRAALQAMQGDRCAYCEDALYGGGHIEHLFRKRHHPERTFDWTNLFLSCDGPDHCGHYKDRPGAAPYAPADLVKPDDDDPRQTLYFHSSGNARPRHPATPNQWHRAGETIRVFNLNHPALVAARERAVARYFREAGSTLDEICSWDPEIAELWRAEELQALRMRPFFSTLRDLLA